MEMRAGKNPPDWMKYQIRSQKSHCFAQAENLPRRLSFKITPQGQVEIDPILQALVPQTNHARPCVIRAALRLKH
jgi:hypothetical protein